MTTPIPKSKWTTKPLTEVAAIERQTVAADQIPSGTKYVGLEHITGSGSFLDVKEVANGELASTKFRFSKRHILYGKLRPYLSKIARPDYEGVCSTDILPILPGKEVDRGFLYYFLRQPHMVQFATSRSIGANLPRLSPRQLAEFQIPLPPLSEQKRIADILDKADAIRRKRQVATAEFHNLLRSAFLDFFGDPLANPKGWPMSSFGDQVAKLEYGPRFYNEPYSPDGVRIVRITDLDFLGRLDFDAMPRMTVPDDVRAARCLQPGDIILARSGATVGKSALIEKGAPACIAGAYFIRLQFKPVILPLFAKMTIDSRPIQTIIAEKSKQSAQQNFSGPGIRALPLPIPPTNLQEEFVVLRKRIRKGQVASAQHYAETNSLFNSLVQRAFKGEL